MGTLVVTNDFPPRRGGIEHFVRQACSLIDDEVTVLTREEPGQAEYDASLPFAVRRIPGPLLPTPTVRAAAVDALRSTGSTRVLFGASAPLALLAPALRRAGAERIVGLTHGHEVWWARVPGARSALRRIAASVDVLGYIAGYTRDAIAAALRPRDRDKLRHIPPPLDVDRFSPGTAPTGNVVLAVGRLVDRKGFDTLLRAWPVIRSSVPDAELRIIGVGPDRPRLDDLAAGLDGVHFLGEVSSSPVDELVEQYRQARVFALPVRDRLGGLEVEGLGMVFCEAAGCGVPIVVGRSGGTPETVEDGVTGLLLERNDPFETAASLTSLLADPARAAHMGRAGRELAVARFGAATVAAALNDALRSPSA